MKKSLIDRKMADAIIESLNYLPVVTLTGPRQSGKTTLCRELFPQLPYVNLEDVATLSEIQTDTKAFLGKFPNGAIIDEAQNYPELFSYLQVSIDADRHDNRSRHYIVTGSNNFSLMEKISQSMAGRTAVMTLLPLSIEEILQDCQTASTSKMILNGGYPAIWKADEKGRRILLSNYYTTYIERDVRKLINIKDLRAFQTFIRLCAGRIGQEFNASSLSIEVGVSVPTIKNWLSILAASYVVYQLFPYHTNIGKRLTKTPKLYFYDTGLAAFLLGILTEDQLDTHPLRGNLFENMVVNEMIKQNTYNGKDEQFFFYRDKSQREVDVLRICANDIEAYEIKSSKTYSPTFFANLNYLKTLLPEKITKTMVIYDGEQENFQPNNGICNFRHLND